MPVADTRLYDLLGVPPTASVQDIRKAYRRLALKHHPDKGGDVAKFQEMAVAHGVLTHEAKRRMYDQFGEEGVSELRGGASPGWGGGDDAEEEGGVDTDLFELLFRRFGGGGRQRPTRNATRTVRLQVSLEEVYAGVTKSVSLQCLAACTPCRGSGSAERGGPRLCGRCSGRGKLVVEHRTGIFVARSEATCPECRGSGRHAPPEAVCPACRGRGVRQEARTLEVPVPAGAKHGERFLVAGAGDQLPGTQPGDVVCVLNVAEHPRFRVVFREHLLFRAQVSLAEALWGCAVETDHLDGRRLVLRPPTGRVIKPDSWWRVRGKGMPVEGSARGDLLVNFAVLFPDTLDAATASQLDPLLRGGRPAPAGARSAAPNDNVEVCVLEAVDPSEYSRAYRAEARSRL